MKSVSSTYAAKETAEVRKPVELYRIFTNSLSYYWYYTNGDVPVVFGGNTYVPATIGRGSCEYNSNLDTMTMKIQFGMVTDPTVKYIAQNPVDIVWVEVSRLFRDQSPLEKSIIFIGQIKTVSFKGTLAEAEVVSFEHFLQMPLPVLQYQIACNHQVFDAGCALIQADYEVSAEISLDATGTLLTSAEFADFTTGYFNGGLAVFGDESRTIVDHTSNVITMQYAMQSLQNNDEVVVTPGCLGDIHICKNKFNNIVHFLGFPFIPLVNPALRLPTGQ